MYFDMSTRLAYVVTHPIQYQAPLLRRIAREPGIDLTVIFLSDFSLRAHHEDAFAQTFRWDLPLTDGYKWECIGQGAKQSSLRWPVGGLKRRLRTGNFDAVWVHGWGRIGLIHEISAAHSLVLAVL